MHPLAQALPFLPPPAAASKVLEYGFGGRGALLAYVDQVASQFMMLAAAAFVGCFALW